MESVVVRGVHGLVAEAAPDGGDPERRAALRHDPAWSAVVWVRSNCESVTKKEFCSSIAG